MTRTDAMRHLVEQLDADKAEREASLHQLRVQVRADLDDNQIRRQEMAHEQEASLRGYMEDLRSEARRIQDDAIAFLAEASSHRQETAIAQRKELAAYCQDLSGKVKESRQATLILLADLRMSQQEMSDEQKSELSQFVVELQEDVASFRQDTRTFVRELRANRQEVAAQQRVELAQQVASLKKDLLSVMAELREEHEQVHADLASAHAIWLGSSKPTEQAQAPLMEPLEEELAAETPEEAPSEPEEAETVPAELAPALEDDLSVIHGIGASTQQKLNEVGITTFGQLAETTSDELRELIEVPVFAEVEEWINQAKELVK